MSPIGIPCSTFWYARCHTIPTARDKLFLSSFAAAAINTDDNNNAEENYLRTVLGMAYCVYCYSYPAIDVQRTAGEFVNCLLLSLLYGNNNNSCNTNITPSITKMTNNENIHDNNNYMEEEEDGDDKDRPSHKRTSTTILAAYVCLYSTSILQCCNPCALQDYILNINKVLQLLILLLYSSSSSSNYHLLLHKAIAVTV